MKIRFYDYYSRLYSCFLGKAIGGTLGMPYEGEMKELNLTFYDPVPTEMVGNDDLDYQIIWLENIRRHGMPVNRYYLAKSWTENIRMVWDEYGVAQRNIKKGIMPPLSGAFDNKFDSGLGSTIRSEIWACLAPGDPDLAVKLALEYSCVDHNNIGVECCVFWTAMESLAFVENDIKKLIERSLTYIDPKGRHTSAILKTVEWWEAYGDTHKVREMILKEFPSSNFTDVCVNIPFMILGLLSSDGDFSKAICNAVNCGYDTDCTGASVGALMGILHPEGIDEKWVAPIGEELVLSPFIVGMHNTDTIEKFCQQITQTCQCVLDYYSSNTVIDFPKLPEYLGSITKPWKATDDDVSVIGMDRCRESTISVLPYYINIKYPEAIALKKGETGDFSLKIMPVDFKARAVTVELCVPDGWNVSPSSFDFDLSDVEKAEIEFKITAPSNSIQNYVNYLDIKIINNGLSVVEQAPLMQTMQWKDIYDETENIIETANHYFSVSAGKHILETEIKCSMTMTDLIMVSEGTKKYEVYIDGKKVGGCNGLCYVPACHRTENRSLINLTAGWHKVKLELDEGEAGEVFFGLFKPYGNEWIDEIETSL